MFRKGIYLVLVLCAALCCPTMARADEVNYIDSFNSGFDTLKGTVESEIVTPEDDFINGYNPKVLEVKTVKVDEEPSILSQIQQFVNRGLAFYFGTSYVSLAGYGSVMLLLRDVAVPVAVLFVFFWWGLRKTKNIIMSAFRKGRANV